MLWSSRKMRQSRSVISAADFSDQCLRFASAICGDATREPRRISDASSSVTRPAPVSRRDWATSAICRRAPSSATTRRSTPARARGRTPALVWPIVQGVQVREVSWSLSQSNLNLNLSLGLTFFFAFGPPMYCARSAPVRARAARLVERVAVASMVEPSVVGRFAERERARPNPGWGPRVVRALFRSPPPPPLFFSAAASRSFLLTNDGRADAFASASRFLTSSSRDRGCA